MIDFADRKTLCVFPEKRADLEQALSELNLGSDFSVIVLIGGAINKLHAKATLRAIQTIATLAQDLNILVICGGTDMGVMAKIGQVRSQNNYTFPLVGITVEAMATWPGGPPSTKFLWWGTERVQLEPHYPYFILTPGSQFGDESPWIIDAATYFSEGHESLTVLINGGEVSRQEVQLSLEEGRPILVLSHTGRLADEISQDFERNGLITVVSANMDDRIREVIRTTLHINQARVIV